MKITKIQSDEFDFGYQWGLCITLENGYRNAVRIILRDFNTGEYTFDSEELPERFLAIGKALRQWAREHEKKD